MGAILGGVSGFILLLISYIGVKSTPKPPPIQEVRLHGLVGSTEKNSKPGMLFPGLGMEPLKRSDYQVIGMAHGKGCAHFVALWPLPLFWVKREGGALKLFSCDAEAVAENAAWYEAIDSLPKADVMLSPRTHTKEENSFALWYRRDCVDLTGKAIAIKLDETK
jgi:hypothetical protein